MVKRGYISKCRCDLSICISQLGLLEHCRLYNLNNRHLCLTVLEAGKSRIKVTAHWIPGESLLPRSQMTFCLGPYTTEKEYNLSFSYEATNLIMRTPPSWLSFKADSIPKSYLSKPLHWKLRLWQMNVEDTQFSTSIPLFTKGHFEMSRKMSFPDCRKTFRVQRVLLGEY